MNALNFLIYLDESLSTNLNSLVIDGYIETRTSRFIEDRTLSAKACNEGSNQHYDEDRYMRDERDGYKGKNFTEADTNTIINKDNQCLEGRRFVRREEEYKRTYTQFEIHQQLMSSLNNSNLIRELNTISNTSDLSNISSGDFIKIKGEISDQSIVSYVDSISNLLCCIGVDNLNSITSESRSNNTNLINYDVMYNQLNYLKSLLTNNGTQDMIIKSGDKDIVLMINNSNFINTSNAYDSANCPCTVIGKVIRKCETDGCIHLLRKSGQPDFYEKFLNSCKCLMDNMSEYGICLPSPPKFKVEGETLLLIPISISI